MRILDKEGLRLGLPELGFSRMTSKPSSVDWVARRHPFGHGPTGSGKTTTLYSCLNFINRPDRRSSRWKTRLSICWLGSTRCK